jgi:hypothetical protein
MNAQKTLGSWRVKMEYQRALRRLFLVQAVWVGIVFLALQLQSLFTFERLFVLWYVGFITSIYLFAPSDPSSRWWRSLQFIAVLGFIGLSYFVVARTMEILSF